MVQIELQPEIESALAQRANAQGIALERFMQGRFGVVNVIEGRRDMTGYVSQEP